MVDYDPHEWRSHLLDIRGSMVREISYRVLLCVAWSAIVASVQEYCRRELDVSLAVPPIAHALIGVFLSLLLVFRTNSSYERFWEGRKQWGSIVNESRNLGRLASVVLASDPDLARRMIGWTIAFSYATMHHLRGKKTLGSAADNLRGEDLTAALEENHLPLVVARRITEQIIEARRRGLVSDYVMTALDQNVQQLVDYMGACERIHKTPMPFAYMVHQRRAVIFYCFTLPFALLDPFGWWTILVTLLIAYTLYGIEEIGVEIEDPFGEDDNDLPLERFCATIELNLREMMNTLPGESTTAKDDESTVLMPETTRPVN